MKIFQVHNYYQQAGGEDAVVAAEASLLRSRGNIVVTFYKTNDDIQSGGSGVWGSVSKAFSLLSVSLKTIWNWETYREVRRLLRKEKPDVVHCHNTFPLISPSIYWACAKESVPVVQTLHNYRLLCLNAFLFRQHKRSLKGSRVEASRSRDSLNGLDDLNEGPACFNDLNDLNAPHGAICELCVKKAFKWPGVKYGCYRDSKAGSLIVAVMLFVHKMIGTWSKKVTAYIALTEFQKQKMIEGGLPEQKIWVKPNFINLNTEETKETEGTKALLPSLSLCEKPYCLFVGRLSPEKGCDVLLKAWGSFQQAWSKEHGADGTPSIINHQPSTPHDKRPCLLIVGDGPERETLEQLASRSTYDLSHSTVRFLGKQPKESVLYLMRNAQILVVSSVLYEGFPMTIVEAFSQKCPVIAAGHGGMAEALRNGGGLLFNPSDSSSLSEKLSWAFVHPEEMRQMGKKAQQEFDEKYSAEINYQQLTTIYNVVVGAGVKDT